MMVDPLPHGSARPRVVLAQGKPVGSAGSAAIEADEAQAGILVGQHVARIKVRSQVSRRDSGGRAKKAHRLQHELTGDAAGAIDPAPDAGLGNVQRGSQLAVIARDIADGDKGFEGSAAVHGLRDYTQTYDASITQSMKPDYTRPYKSRRMAKFDPERLRGLMEAKGFTEESLAAAVGVKQPSINRMLHGLVQRSRYLPDIARVLGTTIDYLMRETDDVAPGGVAEPRVGYRGPASADTLTPAEREWLANFRRLSPGTRQAMQRVVRTAAEGERKRGG